MNCAVCGESVGENKKFICYIAQSGQVTLCTSCITKGVRKGSGSIVTKDGVIPKPSLVFASSNKEVCEIAMAEGWTAIPGENYTAGPDEQHVQIHWEKAQQKYWFSGDGEWEKAVSLSVHECFRRSCRNIRDYYGVWMRTAG
jgi:hypothetical protein